MRLILFVFLGVFLCATAILFIGTADTRLERMLVKPAVATHRWVAQDYRMMARYGDQMAFFEGQMDIVEQGVGGSDAGNNSLAGHRQREMRKLAAFAQTYGLVGLERDPVTGAELMEDYLENFPDSRIMWNDLAVLYLDGRGVAQDPERAIHLLETAVLESSEARFNMGLAHFRGLGVPQNHLEAYKWLEIAAACTSNIAHGYKRAARARDLLAKRLTPEQRAESERSATLWMTANDVSYENWFCQRGQNQQPVQFDPVTASLGG